MQQKDSTYSLIDWRDDQPYSTLYDDVYFSTDPANPQQGLAETHHVFLTHNQLETRFKSLTASHFTVAETGFGTGLNFLCTCQLWFKVAPKNTRLHFISVEKHPLDAEILAQIHAKWPHLQEESQALLAQYQALPEGFHRFQLWQGRVILTLLIGDACSMLAKLHAHPDAWFLDGFSPAKNPEMWQPALYAQMARLSHASTTFATFTSAGDVRRGLISAGFAVNKTSGYGRKREMLYGHFSTSKPHQIRAHGASTAVVVGAGIAGCATAYALAARGWQVQLIERHTHIAQEASGNPRGVLYPRLASHANALDQLSCSGYLYTIRLLQTLSLETTAFQACGLLQLAFNAREQQRIQEVYARQLSASLLNLVSSDEASRIAGIKLNHPALYFPQAGWINPHAFCTALIQHPNITLHLENNALRLQQYAQKWQVFSTQGCIAEADAVVLTNANDALQFLQSAHLPITTVRGQMSTIMADLHSQSLKCVVCTDGYMTPALQHIHCLGATFSAHDHSTEIRDADNISNLNMVKKMSEDFLALNPAMQGRVALRSTTPDYLPLLGELIDASTLKQHPPKHISPPPALPWHHGLFINVAHGAKGLTTAPFCAEILASLMSHEPSPVEMPLLQALNPNRYLLREMGLKRLILATSFR
ncbi:MAG: bifunctional tRNA (5-methylaminomethyl-2-thiouridine)(34)-methyltransferase MnmD/FAD-dependent 5-carboxymethylaminomethyl-2-thiouridine(34) oxidoreductase MnmC [Methylophilus sp.]|nr:bifunctional tRNA (5-methylaminomethyl-2-thiouridine)(34)-methyltransferase MnmD/FAD-dependent 5-carboxymethylaminomethyl-2-thiouridine(34) oxidoreductase MnmC [Methylophilus sp.]